MDLPLNNKIPLCVDLDGTLLRSDLLYESFLMLARQKPLTALQAPLWLLKGKANLKAEIASRVDFSDARLPLNEDVLAFVREAQGQRPTALVTGSHQSLAENIAEQTGLFDRVQGSDSHTNLTRERKRDWLVGEFGKGGFDYIGNDRDDLVVWPEAREALAVSQEGGITSQAKHGFSKVFPSERPGIRDFLSLMRVHQWSKNALILVPFVLDKRFDDMAALGLILVAFLAMSLLCSATYILNDMLDLQADRRNSTKSKRVLASGRVSLSTGVKVMGLLFSGSLMLTAFLPLEFNTVLAAYLVLTLMYSFVLKRKAILDVIMIAALHTLRVIAGTVAISAAWSFWLLAFSMFVFFSLAMAKRVAEVINLENEGKTSTYGRDYQTSDKPLLVNMGVSTGFLSILVVALYINGEKVAQLYQSPMMLWLLCPVLMYWIGRIWLITSRGKMHEDPIVFAMRDRISLVSVATMGLVVLMAMFA